MSDATPTPQIFPPTLREVMLRPRWLGVLALCLVIAGVFAWLGQWQLSRAIDTNPPAPGMTEEIRPLADVVQPGAYLPEPLVGQIVTADGDFVADDFFVVSGRFNDDVPGYWVTGQFRVADATTPTSIAVAVGFTDNRVEADAAATALDAAPPTHITLTGRIISDEGPVPPARSQDVTEMGRMSTAALLNLWHDADDLDVYRPYMTSAEAFGGLTAIDSPAPELASPVNWLNVFYAAEWVVFAGFAFYLWYRLAKDALEKETEALEDAAADAAAASGGTTA